MGTREPRNYEYKFTRNKSNTNFKLKLVLDLRISRQQFEKLANANRDLRLEKTAQGKLIVNPPTGWETGKRNLNITRQLGNWYEENPEKGEVFD